MRKLISLFLLMPALVYSQSAQLRSVDSTFTLKTFATSSQATMKFVDNIWIWTDTTEFTQALRLGELGTVPGTPASGFGRLYVKSSDSKLYFKNDGGTESDLTAGSGSGDVTKVGTPVDNEIGVWTGDGTLEGDTNFQWSGTNLIIGGGATASRLRILEASGSGTNYTEFVVVPQAANIAYSLPPDDGDSGEQLQTDGAGVLTWEASGGAGTDDILGGTGITVTDGANTISGGDATVEIDLTANLDWTGIHTFETNELQIQNIASTFQYRIGGSAIIADRTVLLPLLTTNDTFIFASAIQVLSNKTLTVPTISGTGFQNAQHAHAAANSGGLLVVTGALDGGSITSNFGNIDNGASSIAAGSFDASDGSITNVSTIALDGILPDATDVTAMSAGGDFIIGGGATASNLRLLEASGSGTNYTEFVVVPQAGNITYSLPPDDGDSGEVLQTNGTGTLTWEADATGGTTVWSDIGNPSNSGLTTITFDNAETTLLTGDNDAVVDFFTIQNTDADHANNMYLLNLDYSADDGDVDADFIKFQDSGSIVMTIQSDGQIATDGGITTGGSVGIGTTSPGTLLDVQGAAGAAGIATLSTAELTVVSGDILGSIYAQAPLESSGTDAILVSAAIDFVATATFAADNDSTDIVFRTGQSETATEKMRLTSGGRLGIGTATPLEELHVVGEIFLDHTATAADEHALEIDVDAAGFGDIKGLEIEYDTGAISTGEIAVAILVDFNEIDAVGGDVIGLEILATDGGADNVIGIKVGAEIDPLLQASGSFANPTLGTNNTNTTNVPDMVDGSTGTNTTIFAADNDFIIIGAGAAFTEIEFVIETGFGNPGIAPVFAFSTSGTNQFTNFTPTDGTDGFKNAGAFVVAWDADEVPGHVADDVTGDFDIRITRTANPSGSVSLFYAKTAATRTFEIDKSGNVRFLTYIFEGATDDANEHTLNVIDPTADRLFNFPDDQLVAGDVLVASDASDLEYLNLATTEILIGDGSGIPTAAALSGEATMDNAGVVTLADGVTVTNWALGTPASMVGTNLSGTGASFTAGVSTLATVTDNESTAEENPIVFVAGADPDGGTLGLETDGTATYNPSTGTLTTTEFVGGGVGITGVTASHAGTITWTGTSILESGAAFQFGDASDATLTHTYANTGTNVTIAYSTAAMAITGALTATSFGGITEANLVDKSASETMTGNWIFNSNLSIGNAATSSGVLTILEDTDAGSNFASFQVPALAANTVYTLPPDDGDSGELLRTDGAGVLTWVASAGGGDMLKADFADSLLNHFQLGPEDGSPAAGDSLLMVKAGVLTRIDIGDLPAGAATGFKDLPVQSAKLTGGFITVGAGIDAGDGNWRVLFDASVTESILFQFRMPSTFSSGIVAKIQYSMTSATSLKIDWEVEVMAVADGEDPNTASFDTVNEVSGGTTVPGTAGFLDSISITLTNDDSIAAGELCLIRINRDHDDADDTATGDGELVGLTIEWTE